MSRYIAVMPSTGRTVAPAAHSVWDGASAATTSAISAKVGDAASRSQGAVPVVLFAVEDIAILRFPSIEAEFEGGGRGERVTSVTGFRWTR